MCNMCIFMLVKVLDRDQDLTMVNVRKYNTHALCKGTIGSKHTSQTRDHKDFRGLYVFAILCRGHNCNLRAFL